MSNTLFVLQIYTRSVIFITSAFFKVSFFTSISRQQEFEKSTKSVTRLFAITYFITVLFSVLSCMRSVTSTSRTRSELQSERYKRLLTECESLCRLDGVRNKVWLACLGVISTGLAVLSSFGFLLLLNVPFVITVASSPFLILGKPPAFCIYYLCDTHSVYSNTHMQTSQEHPLKPVVFCCLFLLFKPQICPGTL